MILEVFSNLHDSMKSTVKKMLLGTPKHEEGPLEIEVHAEVELPIQLK